MKFGACGGSEIGWLENEQSVFQSYKRKDKGGNIVMRLLSFTMPMMTD